MASARRAAADVLVRGRRSAGWPLGPSPRSGSRRRTAPKLSRGCRLCTTSRPRRTWRRRKSRARWSMPTSCVALTRNARRRCRPGLRLRKRKKDSIGGALTCAVYNPPGGLGEPCFDKLEAKLAHAMLSIPATKGFEIGSGFDGVRKMHGSEHNDMFYKREDGSLGTKTNNSGGIQGGISNGEPIIFRIAFKPPSTIGSDQATVNFKGADTTLAAKGRHDPCVVPRAVSIVETMTALVIADAALTQLGREKSSAQYDLVGKAPRKAGVKRNGTVEGDAPASKKAKA
mmetsp:Transcript_21145/g.41014  ORF Transcript_21145/g.41014 Transcript_21145/m.41014 type:complete len:286 (-) Transcript_21145:222-1079(-)